MKTIQIEVSAPFVFALQDDGSIWQMAAPTKHGTWEMLPPISQPAPAIPAAEVQPVCAPGYRFFAAGECCLAGDEEIMFGDWKPVPESDFGFIPESHLLACFRRPVTKP